MLPQDLLRYLADEELLPEMDTREYWSHVRRHCSWASEHEASPDHIPAFLYGDDTKFNEQEKLCVLTLGWVLDPRKNSMLVHHPLCVLREVPWLLPFCISKIHKNQHFDNDNCW